MCRTALILALCFFAGHAFADPLKVEAAHQPPVAPRQTIVNDITISVPGDSRLMVQQFDRTAWNSIFKNPNHKEAEQALRTQIANKGYDGKCTFADDPQTGRRTTSGGPNKAGIDTAMKGFRNEAFAKRYKEFKDAVGQWEIDKKATEDAAAAKANAKTTQTPATAAKPTATDVNPRPASEANPPGGAPQPPAEGAVKPPAPTTKTPEQIDTKGKELATEFQAISDIASKAELELKKAFDELCDPKHVADMMTALKEVSKMRDEMHAIPGRMPGYVKTGWGGDGNGKPPGAETPPAAPPAAPPATPPNSGMGMGNNMAQNSTPTDGKKPDPLKKPDDPKVDIKGDMKAIETLISNSSKGDDSVKDTLAALTAAGKKDAAGASKQAAAPVDDGTFAARMSSIISSIKFSTPAVPAAQKRTTGSYVRSSPSRAPASSGRGIPVSQTAVQRSK